MVWAGEITDKSDETKKIIFAAAQNILYCNDQPWVKSDTGLHDVTMGRFARAEICELVGLYLLNKLRERGFKPCLYRDDGLLLSNKSKNQNEKDKKIICAVFREENLGITVYIFQV